MQLQSTTNYSQFKLINSNREVSKSHVRKLKEAISTKNLLQQNPILVNNKLEVIDGQHRLQAAKELEVEVFYTVGENLSHDDISILNTNKRNWTLSDYLNYHFMRGVESYKKVSSFIRTHPKIPLSGSLLILGSDYKGLSVDFREGTFRVKDYDKAVRTADQIKEISELGLSDNGKHIYGITFIRVYIKIIRHLDFDFDKLLKQIKKAPRSFVPCANDKQYIEMLEEVYNRDIPEKNRISFRNFSTYKPEYENTLLK